jgi:hypothetical protein
MLFSSIEEAWVTPNNINIEQFKNNTQTVQQCSSNCDELIKKILSCPSCYDKLLKRIPSAYSKEYQFFHHFYEKYFLNLSPRLKERLINFLMIIAVVLVVMIIQ